MFQPLRTDSPAPTSSDIRRRTCVVCGKATPNSYVTSFTRVPERQEDWVRLLANGDEEYALEIKAKLATGRKYLCLDHFAPHQLTARKSGDGIEIIRNSTPTAFKNTNFVRNHHEEILPTVKLTPNTPTIPEKRQKMSNEGYSGKGSQLDANSMALLMNAVNYYVEQAMRASEPTKQALFPTSSLSDK